MTKRLAAAIAMALLWASPLLAGEIHVTTLADSGPGSLREAIARAAPGETIVFDVTGTITLSSGELVIDKDLTITGPGPSGLVINGNNSSRVFHVRSDSIAAISGVTIQNGVGGYYGGGGIYNDGGMLTVADAIFTGNGGGGIFNYRGTADVTNSIFSRNLPSGIYNYVDATMTVTNCTVSGHKQSASDAGGIHNEYYATLTLTNCTITGNDNAFGGGIFNEFHAKLTIINSTISDNSAYYGGAIWNYRGEVTLINSTVSRNSARLCGGGIINARGGETSSYGGSVLIINSTLSGNSAPTGAALCNVPLGIRTPPMTLQNSVLANNPSGGNCLGPLNIKSQGYNLSDDGTCAEFFTQTGDKNNTPAGLDPGGLKDNGGPTKTIALLATSPAVDAIPSGACTDAAGNPNSTDQRGVERPQGLACDIGAYEFQTPAQATQTLISAVRALGLPRGIERGLLAQLQAALNAISRNDGVANVAARNHLQIFIYALSELQGALLTAQQAADLVAAAERIMQSLGGSRPVPARGLLEKRGRFR